MALIYKALWGDLAILCAWAFSHVVGLVNPQEKVKSQKETSFASIWGQCNKNLN